MQNIELNFKFHSLNEFYLACHKCASTGDRRRHKEFLEQREEEDFIGLSRKKILSSKFAYKEGLEELKKISDINSLNAGGTAYKKKWDEFDGEDMSMERLYEGDPSLIQKKRIGGGKKTGKFITLKIVISVNCGVSTEQMLWKTYTAAKIADMIEKKGMRLKIIVISNSENVGIFDNKRVSLCNISVTLKDFSQPFNLPLLITCVSPWFFRHWVFIYRLGQIKCNPGLGYAAEVIPSGDKSELLINIHDALSKKDSDLLIKKVEKQIFEDE